MRAFVCDWNTCATAVDNTRTRLISSATHNMHCTLRVTTDNTSHNHGLHGTGNRDYCAVATQRVSKWKPCWPDWRPASGRGQCVYTCHRVLESSMAQTDASDFYNKMMVSKCGHTFAQQSSKFGPGFGHLLQPPAWKQSMCILKWKISKAVDK